MELAPQARLARWRSAGLLLLAVVILSAGAAYIPARNAFYLAWHAQHHADQPEHHVHPALRWVRLPEVSNRYQHVHKTIDGINGYAATAVQDTEHIAAACARLSAALSSHDHTGLRQAADDLEYHAGNLKERQEMLVDLQRLLGEERGKLSAVWERRWPDSELAQTAALEVEGCIPPPAAFELEQARTRLIAARTELEQHAAGQLDRVEFFTGSAIEEINFSELELTPGRHGTRRVEAAMAELKLVGYALTALDNAASALVTADAALTAVVPAQPPDS